MTGECECKSRVGPMFHCLKCMEHCAECNPPKLTDEVLADLLDDVNEAHGEGLRLMLVQPSAVYSLVREVQALRSEVWGLRADERTQANAAEAARTELARLLRAHAERDCALASEVQRLRQELHDARKAATTAQTMAAHWKIQATGKALEED